MNFKSTLPVIALLFAFSGSIQAQEYAETWDRDIKVGTAVEKFDGEQLPCYTVAVCEAKQGAVRTLVMDQIKMRTEEKASKKKVMSAVQLDFPNMDVQGVDVKVKTDEEKKAETVNVYAAFNYDGKYISPSETPKADEMAKEVMHNLGVILNQSVVGAQIAETESALELQKKKHDAYIKEKEKLEKAPAEAEDAKLKLEGERKKLEEKLTKAETKAASLQVSAEAATSTSKDINKYASAKKSVTSLEGKLLKNDENVKKVEQKLAEAEQELPDAISTVEESQAMIDTLTEKLAKLNTKYDAIK